MFEVDQSSINNSTHLDAIMSSVTRYSLVLLNILILILGFGGNTLVLYGSIVHNALRMDKITLLLVKNVALSDMIVSVLFYLPALVNLLHGRWVLGYAMCFINGWMSLVPSVCQILTLTLLSCYRLALILGKVNRSVRHNMRPWYLTLGVLWSLIFTLPFIFSALTFLPYYDPYTQSCNSADMSSADEPVYKVVPIALMNVTLNLIPILIITSTNIFILTVIYKSSTTIDSRQSLYSNRQQSTYSNKSDKSSFKSSTSSGKKRTTVPSRTIKGIPLICLTFVFSYTPYMVACLSNMGLVLPPWWRTVTFYFASVNTVSNPLIYVAVNLEFRRYVVSLLQWEAPVKKGLKNTVIVHRDISSGPSLNINSGGSAPAIGGLQSKSTSKSSSNF